MPGSQLDPKALDFFKSLVKPVLTVRDWKVSLDKLLASLRSDFVFDNVVIYLFDPLTESLEAAHARAMGRGRSAEADAAWGGNVASQVVASRKLVVQESATGGDDRLLQASYLGLPIDDGASTLGAIVFIRFGGPAFSQQQIDVAVFASVWITHIILKKVHLELLNQMDSLQRKALLQDDFIATISHELRTPLGFIKGYSTTLLRPDTTWTDETRNEFLAIIDEEADRLTELIDNLLESARFQSRSVQIQFQPLRLDALIRDAVNRICARYKDLEVELDLEPMPPIQGDSIRLTQVFENLFNNAIKYAPGSKISIFARKEADALLVRFSDYGAGIPEVHLPHLFDRFYRVPADQTKAGSGLGLYICNHIVMAHHGKIWVESKLDHGTTFHIQLPIHQL